MLAKLKYLKEEEKALIDIKNMITEQATRLKQEECYLKSLMRGSNQGFQDQSSFLKSHKTILEQTALVDDNTVNIVPLEDLQVQSSSQQQHYMKESVHAEEEDDDEEEDEEEEEEGGDCHGSQEEDGINTELMALMQQMREGEHYDDDGF